MNYYDLYQRRLNKYGKTYPERLENGRRANFEAYLKQSPHRVNFKVNRTTREGVLEPYRQNENQTLLHLLCRADVELSRGMLVHAIDTIFLVLTPDERMNSGYNRYVLLKLTHDAQVGDTTFKGYFHASGFSSFQQSLKTSGELTYYAEDTKLNLLVAPLHVGIGEGSYVKITDFTYGITSYYTVTGRNIYSTPGVMYLSIKEVPKKEESAPPTPEEGEEFFWLEGGRG